MVFDLETVSKLVLENTSFTQVLKGLGRRVSGLTLAELRGYCLDNNISTDHFPSVEERNSARCKARKKSTESILCYNPSASQFSIRSRVIKEKLIPYVCSLCGQSSVWRGVTIPLILDHINGDWRDNTLENLRFVCPNCNYTLPTTFNKPRVGPKKTEKTCEGCGIVFISGRKAARFCTFECYARFGAHVNGRNQYTYVVPRPSLEELRNGLLVCSKSELAKKYKVSATTIANWLNPLDKTSVKTVPVKEDLEKYFSNGVSLAGIGRIYGMSGTAIRMWAIKYGIKVRRSSSRKKATSRNTTKRICTIPLGKEATPEEVVEET